MTTTFPSAIDVFVNPSSADTLATVNHASQHDNANDAINALEVKVGIDGSTDPNSLAYKVGSLSSSDVYQLDNLYYQFDGIQNRFSASYQGVSLGVQNPFRLLITLNGIIQSISFPEVVWGTPFTQDGFIIDSDGLLAFYTAPQAGTTFTGRLEMGSVTTAVTTTYPFKAMDILLGAY